MKKPPLIAILAAVTLLSFTLVTCSRNQQQPIKETQETVLALPIPLYDSQTSVEEALLERRSVRNYVDEPLTLAEVSQLLWAAQGITSSSGGRTAPSAGALYPLEVYLLAGEISHLPAGIYHYAPGEHTLTLTIEGDQRQALYEAALSQSAVKDAAAIIIITAVYERTMVKYGERGKQYVHMEVGCAAQNIYFQAVALDLGTIFIGAFHDDQVKRLLRLGEDEIPLGIMPVGRK